MFRNIRNYLIRKLKFLVINSSVLLVVLYNTSGMSFQLPLAESPGTSSTVLNNIETNFHQKQRLSPIKHCQKLKLICDPLQLQHISLILGIILTSIASGGRVDSWTCHRVMLPLLHVPLLSLCR